MPNFKHAESAKTNARVSGSSHSFFSRPTRPYTVQEKEKGQGNQPIQMWPDWFDRWRNKKKSHHPEGLPEEDRVKYDVLERINEQERQERIGEENERLDYDPERVDESLREPTLKKIQTGSSPVSAISSTVSKVGEIASHTSTAKDIWPGFGFGTGLVSAPLSLYGSLRNTHEAITGNQKKKKDRALKGLEAISDLGSSVTSTMSGATQGAKIGKLSFLKPLANIAPKIAGPTAFVKGGTDILRGTIGGGLAGYRRSQLRKMEKFDRDEYFSGNQYRKELEEMKGKYRGVIRFAKQSQTTKAFSGIGRALGGGLTVAGGLGLLGLAGLSTPVGWALLGAAAAVGGGIALYKRLRKHQLGTKILEDNDYRRQLEQAGIKLPTRESVKAKGWREKLKNFFTMKTASMRAHDQLRGTIADHLARQEEGYGNDSMARQIIKDEILGNIGIKPKSSGSKLDERSLLLGRGQRKKERIKRAKAIASALEG